MSCNTHRKKQGMPTCECLPGIANHCQAPEIAVLQSAREATMLDGFAPSCQHHCLEIMHL